MPSDAQLASAAGLALDPDANSLKQGKRGALDLANQAAQGMEQMQRNPAAMQQQQAPTQAQGYPELAGGQPGSIQSLGASPEELDTLSQQLSPAAKGRLMDARQNLGPAQ